MNFIYIILILIFYFFLKTKIKFFNFGFFALFFLPGTFIHELSHFLMAKLLFVPVGKFILFPKIKDRIIELGSVTIAKTDLFRGSLIGLAPFLTSIIIFYFIYNLPPNLIIIYLYFQIFHIASLSFSDIKDFLKILLIAGSVFAIIYLWRLF